MSKLNLNSFSTTEFINRLKIDVVSLKNLIKEQKDLSKKDIELLNQEITLLKDNKFEPSKNFPFLSTLLLKKEYEKILIQDFSDLKDFDEKTEKLKKLEKKFKKENSITLSQEIENLKISRNIEKKKFDELIKKRNEMNKELREFFKKENIKIELK